MLDARDADRRAKFRVPISVPSIRFAQATQAAEPDPGRYRPDAPSPVAPRPCLAYLPGDNAAVARQPRAARNLEALQGEALVVGVRTAPISAMHRATSSRPSPLLTTSPNAEGVSDPETSAT